MIDGKFLVPSAIILAITKDVGGKKYVLCQRRQNTGFADGLFDFSCAGKVECTETMRSAAVREAKEELGININPDDLKFAVLVHKRDEEYDLTYYNGYFIVEKFDGEPTICEKNKCSELKWFELNSLPNDLIPDRLAAYKAFLNGQAYLEYGW